jgi:hypothetical protein
VDATYKQVGESVVFTNDYWSDQVIYMPGIAALGQIAVSSFSSMLGDTDAFNIYEVPGQINGTKGKKFYFLSSKKWPAYLLTLRSTIGAIDLSPFAMFELGLNRPSSPYEPQGVSVHICQVKKNGFQNTVMIQSPGTSQTAFREVSAYLHSGSWFVYGSVLSDPGSGGYWLPSNPIEGLQDCEV